jgi:hypothetical protein
VIAESETGVFKMQLAGLIKKLGYGDSPNYLRVGTAAFETAPDYGHIFRLAARERRLHGVYSLRSSQEVSTPIIPVVYVCEAENEEEADETHRLVWNQDVVPFLIVYTPDGIRLYSGFRHQRLKDGKIEGILKVLDDFKGVEDFIAEFNADVIDEGRLWRKWGPKVRLDERLDWNLLKNLRSVDGWLQKIGRLKPHASHSLIGKYVYLHYLRDRDILSKRKLDHWDIAEKDIFGREATTDGVTRVVAKLDEWLNGGVFPINFHGPDAPTQDHLRRVAATFAGDAILEDGSWQLHLDFRAYDFSYIPIETLSVVYEQFLHAPEEDSVHTRGREAGAYYTPIPVVNFMLAEMHDRKPLGEGMRVLDPSCGSGAFLVQCYRRLIESKFPPTEPQPRPVELRELLERHIFGIDRDPDACGVTELSLTLTLLDYIDPPDLENDKRVKLPSLRNQNIFCTNFFSFDLPWYDVLQRKKFHWIVGNPPWKKLNPRKLSTDDQPPWNWISDPNNSETPVGGNQVAQAFAWAVEPLLAADGEIGMLLPAMTLFEEPSRRFRAAFFTRFGVDSVANFSNLAEVLFAGRSRVPAAAFFYRRRKDDEGTDQESFVTAYSPFVANQEPTRPVEAHTRNETWSLVVNASEVRRVPLETVSSGDGLPWKLATWGSHLDLRLLERLKRQMKTLGDLEGTARIVVSEGLQLRELSETRDDDPEEIEPVTEVAGKRLLDVTELADLKHLFVFPSKAIKRVGPGPHYARKGRSELPLSVCRPPHVVVGAARNFSVYSEEFLIVPARQVGIAAAPSDKSLLKALSVFFASDFALYHQFLTSTQFGVQRALATLNSLRRLPLPASLFKGERLEPWVKIHARLIKASEKRIRLMEDEEGTLFTPSSEAGEQLADLLVELNELTDRELHLDDRERALVSDLVHVRLQLNDGKLGGSAVGPPRVTHLRTYAKRLKTELDAYIEADLRRRHSITVLHDEHSGMVEVDFSTRVGQDSVAVVAADQAAAAALRATRNRLRKQRNQWVYFDRSLRIFQGTRTYLFKPMQRFHWTESQAMFDASEIIAETIADVGD